MDETKAFNFSACASPCSAANFLMRSCLASMFRVTSNSRAAR